jgi:hypothetical protein
MPSKMLKQSFTALAIALCAAAPASADDVSTANGIATVMLFDRYCEPAPTRAIEMAKLMLPTLPRQVALDAIPRVNERIASVGGVAKWCEGTKPMIYRGLDRSNEQ